MEGLELVSFKIISQVGLARSMYIEAIREAKAGNFEKATSMIEEGYAAFSEGHHAHADLIQKMASGEEVKIDLLLMHAEDQMMATDSFKIIAEEFISLHKLLQEK